MPNNRNRNRNRNRNKRNKQQQQQPQNKAEQLEPEQEQVESAATSSNAEISGSNSNGSNTGTDSSSNTTAVAAVEELGLVAVSSSSSKHAQAEQLEQLSIDQSVAAIINNDMGAKNSKQQQQQQQQQQQEQEQQLAAEQPLKAPGSPRQVKVIVHRIVRADIAEPTEQQLPTAAEPAAIQQPQSAAATQQIIVHRIVQENVAEQQQQTAEQHLPAATQQQQQSPTTGAQQLPAAEQQHVIVHRIERENVAQQQQQSAEQQLPTATQQQQQPLQAAEQQHVIVHRIERENVSDPPQQPAEQQLPAATQQQQQPLPATEQQHVIVHRIERDNVADQQQQPAEQQLPTATQQQQQPQSTAEQQHVIVHRIERENVTDPPQQPSEQQLPTATQQQQQPLQAAEKQLPAAEQQHVIVHRIERENVADPPKHQAEQQLPTQQQQQQPQQSQSQQRTTKVIIHQIRVETDEEERARKGKPTIEEISSTTATLHSSSNNNSGSSINSNGTLSPPPRYLVESPSPKNVQQLSQFEKFTRDVQIQELELNSDCSSGEFNYNLHSPLVCEVDSESEAGTPTLAVSPDVPSSSRAEQQEQLRQKRAQKRNALESHFLPQLLSPRYLDSILEENSELGGEHVLSLSRSSSSSFQEQSQTRAPAKLNETFPRSQLDFSRRHKRREEPLAIMLETKLIEPPSDFESCTRLQSALSPQLEDAELVYLSSSASSSVSDLMELELEQAAALAERALIDLDTDASKLIKRPQDDELSSTSTTTSNTLERHSSSNETETENETEGECEVETEVDTEVETEPTSRESTPVNAHPNSSNSNSNSDNNNNLSAGSSLSSLLSAATPTPAETPTLTRAPTATNSANEQTSVELANSVDAASTLSVTRKEFVRSMEKVRELIEMTRREEEEEAEQCGNVNGNANVVATEQQQQQQQRCTLSPSPPPVPPPPSYMHYTPPACNNSSNLETQQQPAQLTTLLLKRQESNDSHCSDSTQHSQCTAIHMATPPPEHNRPPTPPLRQQFPPQQQQQQPPATAVSTISAGETDAERIKKLRLLCTETLASMPFGEQMLEELASVASNISQQQLQQLQQKVETNSNSNSNMPYPLPNLPHISELQLSLSAKPTDDAWLGLPTQADPKLLVCLSPGQRAQQQQTPDQLLDAHEKFVKRRGYHELSAEQVRAMDSEQMKLEQEQILKTAAKMRELRKSLTPTPTPPPVPVKSAETAAKAMSQAARADDVSQLSNSNNTSATATSSFENKPSTAADQSAAQQQQLPNTFEQRTSSSHSSHMSNQQQQHSSNSKFPASMESELARMFPSMAKQGDIFEEQRKRFSNIEHSLQPTLTPQTKRYSNIETSSYESKQRIENGQVVYDYSNSSREQQQQGDKPQKFPTAATATAVDEVDCAPPVPPPPAAANIMSATKLNGSTFIDDAQQQQQQQLSSESSREQTNSTAKVNSSSSGGGTYEEFRQRAKAAIEAIGQPQTSQGNRLDNENLFKDFDALSQQLNAELSASRSERQQRDKSASLFDLSRASSSQEQQLKRQRHAHMQELEREIERSSRSRQERMSSVPRQITIDLAPDYEPRSRRSESLCNLSDAQRPHSSAECYRPVPAPPQQRQDDDWSRYASDLGYSENIARPFAREVEICYQRQRQPHAIRAPRLSASTNDLSSSSSYDVHNAYAGARRHAPMLQQAPPSQQQRPHYASCYSMIERDPNPTYISTTSRRGVSPAPAAAPPAYDRQRRASLPRELHEQQLQYIMSKEEQLKLEFEKLQQERQRLMEQMQRAPTVLQAPPPRRESYRPAPKLPTLSEDEVFRQQMAEEWMHKVAEREERRQHKIIKISKIEDEQQHASEQQANLSDEFLHRVKERRHKLAMPADSDWESGAESQPKPAAADSDAEAPQPPVRVLEGQSEANLRELPRHLREFAKFSSSEQLADGQTQRHEQQERSETATDNSLSSASKKSCIVKTYKVSRLPPSVQAKAIKSEQQQQQLQEQQRVPQRAATPTMTAKLRQRPQKQTRFLLSPQQLQQQRQRRSWSESDLLKEIDNELQLAKGFLFANEHTQNSAMFAPKFKARAPAGTGVWTPKSQTPHGSCNDLAPTPPPPPAQPIWTPQPSPALSGRKEFRPVRFESPTLPRRYTAQQQQQPQTTTTIPPWSYSNGSCPALNTSGSYTPTTFTSNNSDYAETDYSTQFGPVAPTASVSDKIKTFERSASTSELHRPFVRRPQLDTSRAVYRPNEVIYKVKHEYMSEPETETDRPRKMAQLGRRQYDGIGPVTNDGMPIILRSEVQAPHQHEWYKRLYQTIHKQKNGARPSYKSNGYMSEPEPNYDSDYSTLRYRTPNPLRVQSVSSAVNVRNLNQDDKVYGTMPNPIKSAPNAYKNQPGRIENYTTGHSSVSEQQKKEASAQLSAAFIPRFTLSWWDEVMDIFNGWLREHARIPRIIIEFVDDFDNYTNLEQSKLSPLYTEGNLSRALAKESGYTSDSNLVFRKKELPQSSPLSPVEQRQAYKSLQAGGEPPLLGFRKPAPEKPKEIVEEFEFIQITPTLTKIRVSTKPLEEEATKPPTPPPAPTSNSSNMFSHFSKNLPSFIPLKKQQQQQQEHAPLPPNRKSSCSKSTQRSSCSKSATRHNQCFMPPAGSSNTLTLRKVCSSRREPICRSKSTGAVSTLLATLTATKETRSKDGCLLRVQHQQQQQHARLRSVSPSRRPARLLALRHSSRSPVAFGRSISKERSFAEEKKRLENTLPLHRTNFEASTQILRDPMLKSPQDVKQAVRSYATARSKSLPRLRQSSVSTTTRHTMCVPQVRPQQLLDCAGALKKVLPKCAHKQQQQHSLTSAVKRSSSNDSLPRSNSTYSIEEYVPIAPPVTYVSRAAKLQKTRSEGHVPRKQKQKQQQQQTQESVREKTHFWNAYNAKQAAQSQLQSLPAAAASQVEHKYCSLQQQPTAATAATAVDVFDYSQCPIEDLVWQYEAKANAKDAERRFSPTREVRVPQQRELRSPSRRRIDSLRQRQDKEQLTRASSLSSADERSKQPNQLYQCGELAHSATSLTQLERHSPSCRYRNNCARFNELNRFYSTLERVGQLERATSASNFHPLRKDAELLDFDEWRKVRLHERNEKELQYLVGKLQQQQCEHDLLYSAKNIKDVKWRQQQDQALQAKRKSVEDLRENFELLLQQQQQQQQQCALPRQWRRNTLADLHSCAETAAEPAAHLSNELVSTLTKEQIKKLTKQLNEIYAGGRSGGGGGAVEEHYVVTVEQSSKPSKLKVRCNSSIDKEQLLAPVLRKQQQLQAQTLPRATRSQSPVLAPRETRGAQAAAQAAQTLSKPAPPAPPPPPPAAPELPPRPAQQQQPSLEQAINQKIQYFEARQFEQPAKTVYHAREDSSPDEAELMQLIEQNMQARQQARQQQQQQQHVELSNSLTDLSGLYGERAGARVNFHLHSPPERPPGEQLEEQQHSLELFDEAFYPMRSLTPQSQSSACSSAYLQRVYTGEVQKLKQQFERLERAQSNERRDFFGLSSLRRARSDPACNVGSKDASGSATEALPAAAVTQLTHQFEQRTRTPTPSPERGRRRQRSLLMPRIDIISKTAALKPQLITHTSSPSPTRSLSSQVRSLRQRFESPEPASCTQRYLSTSLADLRDVHVISPHLSAHWVAHQHPERTPALPKKPQRRPRPRASSTSPLRPAKSHCQLSLPPGDIFAHQQFDPLKHRPKARYVPDGADAPSSNPNKSNSNTLERIKRSLAVTFQDYDSSAAPPIPPQPPLKSYSNGDQLDFGSDVNVQFKTPMRHEYKPHISEEELAIRQAEHMQKLYQEERRRKYLQELQDMNSRRHTDNFTPSQKSPIALNRYDDFPTDVTLKSLVGPKTVARALYNFQGQSSKELSFRKGDTIYIRRQIDANWYEGEHNAMIGLLPASYVEIIRRDGANTPAKRPSEGQARAKYNFQAQSGVELSLNKGELVTLTRRVDGNWFEGKIANRKGIFPVSYVEVLTDIGAEDIAARTTTIISHSTTNLRPNLEQLRTNINNEFNTITQNGAQAPNGILKDTRTLHKTDALHVDTSSEPLTYRALYKYRPQNSDELELFEGDLVHVLEKCDDGWYVGTSQRTGCFGTFPGNYVERA
ncbi:CAP [Drosophila busckii]|uniref:CAP n=2 Tax=Drosophila busckii TaxID=30019 RepID=A0A0M4EHX6_DROBS|nr:CAP [Drosophila busckii]